MQIKKLFITCGILYLTSSFAQSTLCYKNNYNDPSVVESTIFNGGKCAGKYSINDMKAKGWKIEDIKITSKNNSMNFIYILNKKENKASNTTNKAITINYDKLQQKITSHNKQKQELTDLEEGKAYYIKNCQECHGKKGEIEASGTSRALNKITYEEAQAAIRGYTFDDYDRGMAILMQPYASLMVDNNLKQIYKYLQKINK